MASSDQNISSIADIASQEELEEILSRPGQEDIEALSRLDGDILILGAAGKMGPSLARRAVRAFQKTGSARRVIAVARFSNKDLAHLLRHDGVEVIEANLLDTQSLADLPDAENVVYMAGRKFGTVGDERLPGRPTPTSRAWWPVATGIRVSRHGPRAMYTRFRLSSPRVPKKIHPSGRLANMHSQLWRASAYLNTSAPRMDAEPAFLGLITQSNCAMEFWWTWH
jgi:hypothetical protein